MLAALLVELKTGQTGNQKMTTNKGDWIPLEELTNRKYKEAPEQIKEQMPQIQKIKLIAAAVFGVIALPFIVKIVLKMGDLESWVRPITMTYWGVVMIALGLWGYWYITKRFGKIDFSRFKRRLRKW